jgi:SET domain
MFFSMIILPNLIAIAAKGTTATTTSTSTISINHGPAILDWVRSKEGGFVSEKLEIRRQDPTDDSTPFGVFTTQDIEPEERLMDIPRECYITLPMDEILTAHERNDNPDIAEEAKLAHYYQNLCKLTHLFLHELELFQTHPEESRYAPYMAYLLDTQRMGQVPATYSQAGKNLLRQILGPIPEGEPPSKMFGKYQLPPAHLVDWIDELFIQTGCIEAGNVWQEHVVALSAQRGYDTEFIPLWDMVNHDNGKLNTANSPIHSEEGIFKVWATEHIAAGEEIYATYNFCTDCMDMGYEWGTPGIYRDFGFVERPPQVWNFSETIYFEVIEEVEEDGDGEDYLVVRANFDIYWESYDEYNEYPSEEGVAYLQEQLARLEALEDLIRSQAEGEVPEHEMNMIGQFYHATTNAITLAIEAISEYEEDDEEDEDDEEVVDESEL